MSYFFNVEIQTRTCPDLMRRFDLNSTPEAVPIEYATTQYDCMYNYETGVLTYVGSNGSREDVHLGFVTNRSGSEQAIKDAATVCIQRHHEENRAAQEQAIQRPYHPWASQLNNRAIRGVAEPTQEVPAQTLNRRWRQNLQANTMTFQVAYEQEYAPANVNPVIPEEAIVRVTEQLRAEQDRQLSNSFAQLYGNTAGPELHSFRGGSQTGRSEVTSCDPVVALPPHRQEVAAPRTPLRQTRSTRTKRRHYLTLVPYINFTQCAECFNDRDLKLMRVAALRCLKRLNSTTTRDMPRQVSLWVGYEQALVRYGLAIATEIRRRGFADISYDIFQAKVIPGLYEKPSWIKWDRLRKSHQSYMVLREERREAAKDMTRWGRTQMRYGQPMQLNDVCRYFNIEQRRTWRHEHISEVRHIVNNSPERRLTLRPFVSKYATIELWNVPIEEAFVYPENLS